MDKMGNKIRHLRESRNMTQTELSEMLGMKTYTTVSKWESGENFPKGKDLKKLAEIFKVSSDYLLGLDNNNKISIETVYNQLVPKRQKKVYEYAERQLEEQNNKVVPLLGGVAANPAELTYGDIAAEEVVEYNVPEKADCALVVHGDSMEPDYHDGDIVFYKCQITIENGETAVVEINGDGVTLKKVYFNFDEDKVILRSLNDKYEDRELNPEEVRVLGKVIK